MYEFQKFSFPAFGYQSRPKYISYRDMFCLYHFEARIRSVIQNSLPTNNANVAQTFWGAFGSKSCSIESFFVSYAHNKMKLTFAIVISLVNVSFFSSAQAKFTEDQIDNLAFNLLNPCERAIWR